MPPRFAYWTIILDGEATAFRAKDQAELLPTFNRMKQKNAGAMMKWFSQGTLWDSPEQAKAEREKAAFRRPKPEARTLAPAPAPAAPRTQDRRGREWRPGGEHKDPRDKYKGEPGARRKQWKAKFFKDRAAGGAGSTKPPARSPKKQS